MLTLQAALKTPAAAGRIAKAVYKQQKGAALKLLPFERNLKLFAVSAN